VTAPTLSQTQLNRATLARQMLLERCSIGVVDVVRRLAGMQAQEPRHPFVGLWTRVEGFSGDQLLSALRSREVVRATLMRSTLHLMGAGDYAALRMSLQPRQAVALRVLGARSEGLDLEAVLPAARELLRGQPMAFDDIRARLGEAFPGVNDRALGYAVRTLVPLVMVPGEKDRWGFPRVAEFALAGEWLGEPLAGADPRALVRRYLAAFGPASAKDAQSWSGGGQLKACLGSCASGSSRRSRPRGRRCWHSSSRRSPSVASPSSDRGARR